MSPRQQAFATPPLLGGTTAQTIGGALLLILGIALAGWAGNLQ
jgi:hypothetical protein